jgi:hypothetical protein
MRLYATVRASCGSCCHTMRLSSMLQRRPIVV